MILHVKYLLHKRCHVNVHAWYDVESVFGPLRFKIFTNEAIRTNTWHVVTFGVKHELLPGLNAG